MNGRQAIYLIYMEKLSKTEKKVYTIYEDDGMLIFRKEPILA